MKLSKAFLYSIVFIAGALGSFAYAANAPIVPDPKLTPGRVDLNATVDKICVSGYTATVRDVPESLKKKVFDEYNVDRKSDKFEVDHLISLELGGSNDIMNLWPQSYTTQPWNAYVKDKLENHLHKLVCDGKMDLRQAQIEISNNWIVAYKKYFGDTP